MKKSKIIIKTPGKFYPVYFGQGIINQIGKLIEKNIPRAKKIFIISDKKVPPQALKKLNKSLKKYYCKNYRMSVSEKIKSFQVANKIAEIVIKNNFNRSDCIISFGGGILGDLSAFVSSITKRGMKFINIPTTLLAQVDASIGGKTAINSKQGKNLIGTFYQPEFVLVDLSILDSLPHREMTCGYGEILKHSLISNKKFFLWLCKNGKKIIRTEDKNFLKKAIIKSCKIKSEVISKDEKEKNLRMVLNFGHSFAHGFEGTKNFSKKINHGEAVLLGMMMASRLSQKKNLLSLKELNLIKKHYLDLNLPMKINDFFKKSETKKIIYFMKKDKKNMDNKINLVLLKRIGKTTKPNSCTISENQLTKFIKSSFI